MKTRVLATPASARHHPPQGHPERAERYEAVLAGAEASGVEIVQWTTPAERAAVERVHHPALVEAIFAAAPASGEVALDADTYMNAGQPAGGARRRRGGRRGGGPGAWTVKRRRSSWPPARRATMPSRTAPWAFACSTRWRSRRCTRLSAGAAQRRRRRCRCAPRQWHASLRGRRAALKLHLPAPGLDLSRAPAPPTKPAGTAIFSTSRLRREPGRAEWLDRFDAEVAPKLEADRPEILLVSAGFDAHADDPLAGLSLDDAAYGEIAHRLAEAARRFSHSRLVCVLEGGYDCAALERSVKTFLEALQAA
jgi:hypothetical protein